MNTNEIQKAESTMNTPPIVSAQEWEAARLQLRAKEKEVMRAHDALAAERRRMPWLAVDKRYEFDGPDGRVSLLDLFAGRRQLIVYRAFFEPGVHGWPDHACRGCSMIADHIGNLAHLSARDTTLVFASRAPQADTGPTRSFATVIGCSGRTFSTAAVTSRWGIPGAISTSPPLAGKRIGRTRRRVIRRPHRMSGGTGMTNTTTPLRRRRNG
jgi:uncharacterized protein DUF899